MTAIHGAYCRVRGNGNLNPRTLRHGKFLVFCVPPDDVPGKKTGKDQDPDFSLGKAKGLPKSDKGSNFKEGQGRRKGRSASKRSPDDSPLRDANRDFLFGLLTIRSIRTLIVYLQETNLNLSHWLSKYYSENPITLSGSWKDISGDTWLEDLIKLPLVEDSKYNVGKEELYDNAASINVDPKEVASRVLEVRRSLAKELIEDLSEGEISEANASVLRSSLMSTLENSFKLDSSTEAETDVD